jgi:hypothetical protein
MNPTGMRRVGLTLIGVVALFGVVATAAIVLGGTELGGFAWGSHPPTSQPSATPNPSPSPWLVVTAPGQVRMPDTATCSACHVSTAGTVGVNPIPAIAHPVDGWRQCTACHASDRLVKTAPGHTGIHAEECLVCHTKSTASAPPPKHPAMPNADCLFCHGKTAPLPHDMATRASTLCWLCHHTPAGSPSPETQRGAVSVQPAWPLEVGAE